MGIQQIIQIIKQPGRLIFSELLSSRVAARRDAIFALIVTAVSCASTLPGDTPLDYYLLDGMSQYLKTQQANAERFNEKAVTRFYAARKLKSAWITHGEPNNDAQISFDTLLLSYREGLQPKEYHTAELSALWQLRSKSALIQIELLLTDGLLRYINDVRSGKTSPKEVDQYWHLPPPVTDSVELLKNALATDLNLALTELPPPHQGYQNLRKALHRYQDIARVSVWPKLANATNLRLGERNRNVRTLRKRLMIEGYLDKDSLSDYFDKELLQALKHFQANYGLDNDGIIGNQTLKALNQNIDSRVAEIRQNMERWRWIPRDLGERYIMVNTANFKLYLSNHDEIEMEMRVIVGKPNRLTPSFSDLLNEIVINPSWGVPRSLATTDLLENQRANPDYFSQNNFSIYDAYGRSGKEAIDPATIDWSSVGDRYFPYLLEQAPGSSNALGQIKFSLQNSFRIYLHDTPWRSLFNKPARAMSSGCVRLENPQQLAEALLDNSDFKHENTIASLISQGKTIKLKLEDSIPVYVIYNTVWAERDGEATFHKDIYQRINPLVTRLGNSVTS